MPRTMTITVGYLPMPKMKFSEPGKREAADADARAATKRQRAARRATRLAR